jgi:hypothetical protein
MSARPQRRSGNLSALKVELWAAIRAASQIISDESTSAELRLRAVSAIATAGSVYAKLLTGWKPDDPPPTPEDEDRNTIIVRVRETTNGHHRV